MKNLEKQLEKLEKLEKQLEKSEETLSHRLVFLQHLPLSQTLSPVSITRNTENIFCGFLTSYPRIFGVLTKQHIYIDYF